jgi:hypothetical protein
MTDAQWDQGLARNLSAKLEHRVLALVRLRLEPSGHAHFARGELVSLLEVANRSTGEIRPVSTSTLDRTLAALADQGLIRPEHGRRCVRPVGVRQGSRSTPATPCPA